MERDDLMLVLLIIVVVIAALQAVQIFSLYSGANEIKTVSGQLQSGIGSGEMGHGSTQQIIGSCG